MLHFTAAKAAPPHPKQTKASYKLATVGKIVNIQITRVHNNRRLSSYLLRTCVPGQAHFYLPSTSQVGNVPGDAQRQTLGPRWVLDFQVMQLGPSCTSARAWPFLARDPSLTLPRCHSVELLHYGSHLDWSWGSTRSWSDTLGQQLSAAT